MPIRPVIEFCFRLQGPGIYHCAPFSRSTHSISRFISLGLLNERVSILGLVPCAPRALGPDESLPSFAETLLARHSDGLPGVWGNVARRCTPSKRQESSSARPQNIIALFPTATSVHPPRFSGGTPITWVHMHGGGQQ